MKPTEMPVFGQIRNSMKNSSSSANGYSEDSAESSLEGFYEKNIHENASDKGCFSSTGLVIMASGLGKRFGSNKLLADFDGQPLIQRILTTSKGIFPWMVVVTRHREVENICKKEGIPVFVHDLPGRQDTIRLGLSWILERSKTSGFVADPSGVSDSTAYLDSALRTCIFTPADQPLLTRDTLIRLAEAAETEKSDITKSDRAEYELMNTTEDSQAFAKNTTKNCQMVAKNATEDSQAFAKNATEDNQNSKTEEQRSIIRLRCGDRVGTPTAFPAWTFQELLSLPEGKGGNLLLKKYPEKVKEVLADHEYELMDADTPETLVELLEIYKLNK